MGQGYGIILGDECLIGGAINQFGSAQPGVKQRQNRSFLGEVFHRQKDSGGKRQGFREKQRIIPGHRRRVSEELLQGFECEILFGRRGREPLSADERRSDVGGRQSAEQQTGGTSPKQRRQDECRNPLPNQANSDEAPNGLGSGGSETGLCESDTAIHGSILSASSNFRIRDVIVQK